eukprot:CAMPEP_0206504106 /NCGR_PEP_ID=MMETSP0324_2-20121206/55235_1 /ASSEMBLY_ACC=CAM_ASM_000836 /TAXON_ID=2866 /ORGANISM="Crypthecodinium cohnii, Strain Seligo" /LENGTH=258 /DNA_ID=CAMNT_0053993107 /DNA_START=33 /DNA_END=806 /DNA_ORIENTATION=+
MPIDYSRFDNIGDSDSEDEEVQRRAQQEAEWEHQFAQSQAAMAAAIAEAQEASRPPPNIMEDLEDYFERLDQRRGWGGDMDPEVAATDAYEASVQRFTDSDFERLEMVEGPGREDEEVECAICILNIEAGEPCVVLPCAAKHRFHRDCARSWLSSRSVQCPLCRVDVRELVRNSRSSPATSPTVLTSTQDLETASDGEESGRISPRSFGYTRDGGVIVRYDPRPAPEVERPSYIAPEHREIAELVEIDYPEHGRAVVW